MRVRGGRVGGHLQRVDRADVGGGHAVGGLAVVEGEGGAGAGEAGEEHGEAGGERELAGEEEQLGEERGGGGLVGRVDAGPHGLVEIRGGRGIVLPGLEHAGERIRVVHAG